MTSVIVCLNEELKSMIYSSIEMSNMTEKIKSAVYEELEALPDCEGGLPLDFGDAGKPGKGAPKKKRAPSAYNLFVSDCFARNGVKDFKSGGARMKECSIQWKKGGDKLKKQYTEKLRKTQSV